MGALTPRPNQEPKETKMADVSLDFLASQLERVLNRLGAVEDQITVLTGMTKRLGGAVNGLATEMRGLVQSINRIEHRLRKVEDAGS
jgi:hypothetical protein